MEEVKKQGTESLFVPYKIALELKELGFNEGVLAQYRVDGYLCWGKDDCSLGSDISDEDYKNNCFPEFGCRAPLWQQAFDWFRYVMLLDNFIIPYWFIDGEYKVKKYTYSIEPSNRFDEYFDCDSDQYDTYEEARLECLKRLIELCEM